MMDPCPPRERLEKFLNNGLDLAAARGVAAHVDQCRVCQDLLDLLTDETLDFTESHTAFQSLWRDSTFSDFGAAQTSGSIPVASSHDASVSSQSPGAAADRAALSTLGGLAQEADGESARGLPPHWPAFPDYQILGVLGQGAMGIVYRARQISLNRLVALKVVLAGSGAPDAALRRFRTEAEALARLQHANIVQVFAIGEHEGLPYLALELVEGKTLAQRLNGSPQRPIHAAALVETLARAMHLAHEHDIIHRDLKPSNILLKSRAPNPGTGAKGSPAEPRSRHKRADDASASGASAPERISSASGLEVADYGVPKIADFGLAKLVDSATRLTRTGDLMGTPCYIAPEQAMLASRGTRAPRPPGPAADIYALGAILYEMLTGRPPFEADSALRTLLMVMYQDPISPSDLQPKVPADLATICLKCLEKEPSHRYESALALAEDLHRFGCGLPIEARRTSSVALAWRWCRRRPLLTGMAAALLLSLTAGFVGMTVLWFRAGYERVLAQNSAERAESNLYLSRISQAQLEWRVNNPAGTRSLLDDCAPRAGEPDRRGWEWYFLNNLTHADVTTLNRDNNGGMGITSVRFSADGHRILAGGGRLLGSPQQTGELRAWDLEPWERGGDPVVLRSMPTEPRYLTALAMDAGSSNVFIGEHGGAIKVLEASTGWRPRALPGLSQWVSSLSLNRDATKLAASSRRGIVTVLEVRTGRQLLQLEGAYVRFTADGSQLITAGTNNSPHGVGIHWWDAESGRLLRSLPIDVTGFDLSPDGLRLATWKGTELRVVNVASGQTSVMLANHDGDIAEAAFSPDSMHIATAGADRTVRLWDSRTGLEELVLRGHTERVQSVAFHPNGRYLASADQPAGEVKVWDLTRHPEFAATSGELTIPRDARRPLVRFVTLALGFSADSRRVIEARKDGTLRQRMVTGEPSDTPMLSLPLNGRWVAPSTRAAVSPDGRWIAALDASKENVVLVSDCASGRPVVRFRSEWPVMCIGWSRDRNRLVTAGFDWKMTGSQREVRVWDVGSGRLLAHRKPGGLGNANPGSVYGVAAMSPDGNRVAFDDYAATSEARVTVRDLTDGTETVFTCGVNGPIRTLAFSHDGRLIASATGDGQIYVYDLLLKQPMHRALLQGPGASLGVLAFSPDNRLLAAADREQVQLWHVAAGHRVLALQGAPPRRSDNGLNPRAAWSPDGRFLAALNHDNSVTVWDGGAPLTARARHAEAQTRAFAWHLAHAQSAVWQPELRQAADFHLRSLAGLEPPNQDLRVELSVLYAWVGRWQEAASQFAHVPDAQAALLPPYAYIEALMRLQVNDVAGWQQLRTRVTDQFGDVSERDICVNLIRTSLLAPGGIDDPSRVRRWCDSAAQTAIDPDEIPVFLGALAYRTNQYADAIRHLEEAVRKQADSGFLWGFLAMAHARSGNLEQARTAYTRLEQRADLARQPSSSGALSIFPSSRDWNSWPDWIEARILSQEAREVLDRPQTVAATN